ncbi:MAG: hypothetical protein HQL19_01085 [Candidatus Omnitrophica bacterium]|nr:hypothetical protein [Candidatus Omnitrophota bacterium]
MGLEGEDVAVLILVFGVPAILFSPIVPLLFLFIGWPLLAVIKRGKAEGFMIHQLYRLGVPLQGLLPPGEGRYCAYVD